jgi:hypothetical protein
MQSLTVVARFLALLSLFFAGMVGIVWAQGGDSRPTLSCYCTIDNRRPME